MFWLFRGKKEVKRIEEDTKRSFDSVKKDINSISGWIKHLDSEKNLYKKEIEEMKESLSTVMDEIEGMKNVLAMINGLRNKQLFKTPKQMFAKQTGVYPVQTGVQTGVQTPKLDHFSITEKAILWILLNTNMKLSYDDLASMMGKEKSTIRGQINRIKQKSEGLISEKIEQNGKKRLFIHEKFKEKMLKKTKVRISNKKKRQKKKVSEY